MCNKILTCIFQAFNSCIAKVPTPPEPPITRTRLFNLVTIAVL